jgi:hypothetical protein
MVSCLERACVLFDEVYPDGLTMGVLSVGKPKTKRKVVQKLIDPSQQSTVPDNDALNNGPTITSRHLTNLRMASVLCNADQSTNNSTIEGEGEQQNEEYDSEEEQFGEDVIDNTVFEPLDNNHRLYGYVPDEGYNPHSMEEDGTYPEEFTWTYEDPPEDGLNEDLYRPLLWTWSVLETLNPNSVSHSPRSMWCHRRIHLQTHQANHC